MKKYMFRAEKVLRVRRLQEDIARAGVANARREEDLARQAVVASRQRYDDLSTPPATLLAMDLLGLRDRIGHRRDALVGSQSQERLAVDATAAALSTWHLAHRDVEGLERLDDRRRAEYDIELRRAEDAQVDEIVVSRARRTA